MEEIWKDVKGYEGIYQVSNLGRLKSLKRTVKCNNGATKHYEEKIIKGTINPYGYYHVVLSKNGVQKPTYIHRLVAEAFIPNPENKPQVNHLDENKINNRVDNLEWATHKENVNYGTRTKRQAESKSIPIVAVPMDGGKVLEYKSSRIATSQTKNTLKFNYKIITKVINGHSLTHRKYYFYNLADIYDLYFTPTEKRATKNYCSYSMFLINFIFTICRNSFIIESAKDN